MENSVSASWLSLVGQARGGSQAAQLRSLRLGSRMVDVHCQLNAAPEQATNTPASVALGAPAKVGNHPVGA